ncbi:DUF4184 family protein [Microbacterium sp. ZW T5_56]|uniref:DUF4184 family protein n=1 Tax=Microbacterium sp. ZW T5_56 TaxID=3378081 RepID=UPI00385485A1
MPFTVSHAVVALPFIRTPLVPAAIAIGSMIPDLPMFLRPLGVIGLTYSRTHDYAWLPLTVAVALLALLLWRCVLRSATAELAPRWIAERLPKRWSVSPREAFRETWGSPRGSLWAALLLVLSFALGVVSHILWDSFTHEGRGGTVLAGLDSLWGPLPGYKWLQYGSGVVGMLILGVWAALWWRRQSVHAVQRRTSGVLRLLWWVSFPLVLVISAALVMVRGAPVGESLTPGHIAYGVLPALGVWGLVTLGLCVALAVRSRPQQ